MAVELITFVQEPHRSSVEWRRVKQIANQLLKELNSPATLRAISKANRPGISSGEVQAAFRPSAEKLGFHSERQGLFAESITGLRPDFFLPLGENGVILEVERGKTTTNTWTYSTSGSATSVGLRPISSYSFLKHFSTILR
jgi:hypothetical protein